MSTHLRTSEPVSVVIPAFDEEKAVGAEVAALSTILSANGTPHEIIVVDDGSSDRTADRAAEAGATVIRHAENIGYGAAIKTGIRAAAHEFIVITDADGTYPPDQIPHLLRELQHADMVVGSRTGKTVKIPLIRRPAKWLLGLLANRIAGRRIPDLNSGLRVFRRSCVEQYFSILSNRFSFTTTSTLALLSDDYRIVYRPIDYHTRIGQSKIRPRHFMDFVILVLRMAMFFHPLKVFLPLAFAFGSLGGVKVAFDIWSVFSRSTVSDWSVLYQPVISTSAILLLTAGLQLMLVGLVADSVLRRIARHDLPLVPSRGIVVRHETEPRGVVSIRR